jgi:hypothetical protein
MPGSYLRYTEEIPGTTRPGRKGICFDTGAISSRRATCTACTRTWKAVPWRSAMLALTEQGGFLVDCWLALAQNHRPQGLQAERRGDGANGTTSRSCADEGRMVLADTLTFASAPNRALLWTTPPSPARAWVP